MAKIKERQHVKINIEDRDGTKRFVVVWYPTGKRVKGSKRMRKVFYDEKAANTKADEIERMMSRGQAAATAVDRELAAFLAMREQLAPNTPLTELLRAHISGDRAAAARHSVTCAQVCAEYRASRSDVAEFSKFQIRDVKKHTKRLEAKFGKRNYAELTDQDYEAFLKQDIGGSGRHRLNHLITYRAMSRWARDKREYLPIGPTAAEKCPTPRVVKTEHEVYSPNEFKRLLVAAPEKMVMFYVLGQLSGVRAEERKRIRWKHWRRDEDNKLVLNADVTKTDLRRRVDVVPSLALWLAAFRREPEDFIVPIRKPEEHMGKVRRDAGVSKKVNALRAGYASYHVEKFGDKELTAKNDGHKVSELESTYMSIEGVTKAAADEMFDTTPQSVLEFARANNLPEPEWAYRILTLAVVAA